MKTEKLQRETIVVINVYLYYCKLNMHEIAAIKHKQVAIIFITTNAGPE